MEPHDFAFFEKRKQDHISASLDEKNEAKGLSGLQDVVLYHDALPEINFENVELQSKVFGQSLETPFLVSSMTAGHRDSLKLNTLIARCCSRMGWLMGVGSQRRELDDESALSEWRKLKQEVPEVRLMGNIGLSQLAQSSQQIYKIQKLVDNMEAFGFFVHTNPLQECIQPEGTPQFADGIRSLTELCDSLNVPVVLKETGCGFSKKTLNKLKNTPLAAVDVSGLGGTHWGRIEGDRCQNHEILEETSRSFKDWGVSTVESVVNAKELHLPFEIWASGGLRSGVDAAKLLAMGAQVVGFAKPILEAAMDSEEALMKFMERIHYELKVALFCTGNSSIHAMQSEKVWEWKKI